MSDEDSESSSSESSSEDENVQNPFEQDFFTTLSCLKGKNPKIYDSSVEFFNTISSNSERGIKNVDRKNKEKPVFIKDFEREIITGRGGRYSDDEQIVKKEKTIVELQEEIKDSFKQALSDDERSDDESNGFGGLLKKREKTMKEEEEEEEDYIKWLKGQKEYVDDEKVSSELKPLHDFWNNPQLEEKEEFLKDFILNKRYLGKEEDSGNFSDDCELSEDGRAIDEQEEFEYTYNMRFEDPDELLKRYPRQVEGSLRRKNDKRTRKRAEIRERKKMEKLKKMDGIKTAQKHKMMEIEDKLEELKKIIGNNELAFSKEDILNDFDPEKFDKKMSQLYNDDFYAEGEVSKPDISENCSFVSPSDEYQEDTFNNFNETDDDPNFNMDCESHLHEKRSKKESRTRRKKNKSFIDISSTLKPIYDPAIHESFQKYMDEFYSLDCEDFIDDIPCKFKYRNVIPNDFGLTVDEILAADDKELNRWSSIKKIFKERPDHIEKNEVQIYKQKSKNENLKRKILPSLYVSNNETLKEEVMTGSFNGSVERKSHSNENSKSGKKENSVGIQGPKQPENPIPNKGNKMVKRRKNKYEFKSKLQMLSKTNSDFTDSRLRAYGIKPKKFRRK